MAASRHCRTVSNKQGHPDHMNVNAHMNAVFSGSIIAKAKTAGSDVLNRLNAFKVIPSRSRSRETEKAETLPELAASL